MVTILNIYNTKTNIPQNTKIKIAEFKGRIQAQIETKKSQLKRKRNNNNTGNANRSARRVNTIRPVIMKMTHLTNNQKAFYINQARTNLEKNLNDIKNNALARR
jgi:hypothetical protein